MIPFLSALGVALAMTGSVLLALGKVRAVLALGCLTHAVYIAINVLMARHELALLLLAVPSAWSIGWNLIGLRRLGRTP